MSVELTQKLIKQLEQPPEKHGQSTNAITWDSLVAGFGVRVTSAGVKAYVLNYRFNGRQKRITIAAVGDMPVTAAREQARALRGDVAKGRDPLEEDRKARAAAEAERVKAISFATVAANYFNDSETQKKREKTLHEQERLLNAHVLPALARIPIAQIAPEHISKLHTDLASTKYQANRVLALLSTIFNFATARHLRSDNPCRGVKRYAEDPREHTLDPEQFARVLSALDRHRNQIAAQALKLIASTGSRKTEVLAATWDEFDLKRGQWIRASHRTKCKHYEVIPLNSAALGVLRSIERRGQYLFPGKNGHLQDVKNVWEDVRREAAIGRCRIHDLRHNFASTLVNAGESLFTVGKLLGHRPGSSVTARYAHHSDDALRGASEKVANLFSSAADARGK